MKIRFNNEISREILAYLDEFHPQAVKFSDMVNNLDIDEKDLFKNLFFLEDFSFIQLMSTYPVGAIFPNIHMVKIRDEGRELLEDEEKLDNLFPLRDFSCLSDRNRINNFTILEVIDTMQDMALKDKIDVLGEKDELLTAIKTLKKCVKLSKVTLGKIFGHEN